MDYTEVAQLESHAEAEILKDALEAEGIRFIIHPHHETAFSDLFVEQRGWGSLLVPPNQHDAAREVLEAVRTPMSDADASEAEAEAPTSEEE